MLKYAAVLIFSLTLFAIPANSQTKTIPANTQRDRIVSAEAMNNRFSGDLQERIEQAAIAQTIAKRRVQLRTDTEKLVALTAELKQQVDKTSLNILSMDVIKKAEEIQKLAKSVQDKMRNAY